MKNYKHKPYIGGRIEVGYERDPEDPDLLRPIPEYLDVMEQAMEFMDQGCSCRDVARWVMSKTNTDISHQTIVRKHKKWVADKKHS